MEIANHLPVVRQTHRRRKKALCDAVAHVHTVRITPLGNDVSSAHDHPRRIPARAERTDDLAGQKAVEFRVCFGR